MLVFTITFGSLQATVLKAVGTLFVPLRSFGLKNGGESLKVSAVAFRAQA